jgi:hypothetical protein
MTEKLEQIHNFKVKSSQEVKNQLYVLILHKSDDFCKKSDDYRMIYKNDSDRKLNNHRIISCITPMDGETWSVRFRMSTALPDRPGILRLLDFSLRLSDFSLRLLND